MSQENSFTQHTKETFLFFEENRRKDKKDFSDGFFVSCIFLYSKIEEFQEFFLLSSDTTALICLGKQKKNCAERRWEGNDCQGFGGHLEELLT